MYWVKASLAGGGQGWRQPEARPLAAGGLHSGRIPDSRRRYASFHPKPKSTTQPGDQSESSGALSIR